MAEMTASEKRVGALVGIIGVGTFIFTLGKVFTARSGLPITLIAVSGPLLGLIVCSVAAYVSPAKSWRWGLLYSALYIGWGTLTLLSMFGKEGPKAGMLWGGLAVLVTGASCLGGWLGNVLAARISRK